VIVIKLKATDPNEIREQAKAIFGLVDPGEVKYTVETRIFEPGAEVQTTGGGVGQVIETDAPPPAAEAPKPATRRARKPKAPVEAPSTAPHRDPLPPVIDENGEDVSDMPEFQPPKPADTVIETEASLEDLRAKLQLLLEASKSNPLIVNEMIAKYSAADGKPCRRASEVQPADRAKLIADINAKLKG
jgi:hypothetical protein